MTQPIEIQVVQTGSGNSIQQASDSLLLLANRSGQIVGALAPANAQLKNIAATAQATHAPVAGLASSFTSLINPVGLATQALGAMGISLGVGGIAKLAMLGAEVKETQGTFKTLASQAGMTSDVLLSALRTASQGTASDTELMRSSMKALLTGMTLDLGSMSQLMSVAKERGHALGFETAQAFEMITNAVSVLAPRQLKQLGIVVSLSDAYETYADSVGKVKDALTEEEQQQALLNAVLEQTSGDTGDLAQGMDTAAESLARATAAAKNAADAFATTLAPAIEKAANEFSIFLGRAQQAGDTLGLIGKLLEIDAAKNIAYNTALRDGATEEVALEAARQAGLAVLQGVRKEIDSAVVAGQRWTRAQVDSTKATVEFTFATDEMSTALMLADTWLKKVTADAENYQTALGKVGDFVRGQVSQAVGAVIKPTSVTAEDIAALGNYIDKWDELARQSDIIARDGVGRLAEFPKLSAAMQRTGLDAKQFGEQFRSGAIFADVKPEDLLGLGEISGTAMNKLATDAMGKLKETIGQKHLSDSVSKAVFKNMPVAMRDELLAMGIETLSDAEKIQLGIRKDKNFDKDLGAIVDQIIKTMPISVIFDWGKPPGGETSRPPGEYGGGGGGITPPLFEDYGGVGTLTRTTNFVGHAGESYWFSGRNNEVPLPTSNRPQIINLQVSGQTLASVVVREIAKRR